MDRGESEKNREEFSKFTEGKIRKRVRERISSALQEIMTEHDVFIAASLQVDVRELVRSTAVEEINSLLKE